VRRLRRRHRAYRYPHAVECRAPGPQRVARRGRACGTLRRGAQGRMTNGSMTKMKTRGAWTTIVALTCGLVAAGVARAACDPMQPTRTPSSRYVISGGEVYDKKTDLTWQR